MFSLENKILQVEPRFANEALRACRALGPIVVIVFKVVMECNYVRRTALASLAIILYSIPDQLASPKFDFSCVKFVMRSF